MHGNGKQLFFNNFTLGLGPSKTTLGAPKAPPESLFFRDAPKWAFSCPKIKMIAPGLPFGAKEGVNDPP